ncbi:AEC family transporter [Mycoplasmopsis caviae]|uniref:AEC family transporter n=1 Tax=Mycoplasmopsis caviae TaxID=55603 RepID=A0A3P8MDP7_9BACT|nr:AEC family transporter [Mycoplasmopsis caviae]UUD35094.1 AEC family transporter [Mycoplasmopsis caviae]VDR42090.1 Uncharacterised protein [Mycoplasmopsis caviae]
MEVKQKLVSTLANVNLWSAIIASIVIIGLGYLLVKIKWFKSTWKAALVGVVMKVALPALALSGFMKSISINDLKEQGIVLGVAFAFYILLSAGAWLWIKFAPNKTPEVVENAQENTIIGEMSATKTVDESRHRAMVVWMLLIFGSTTFFGMPIIRELYSKGGLLAAGIWNVPYRIFLYSFCFMQMKGLKFNKENIKNSVKTMFLNPIIIATFAGLILWLTQLIPGAGITIKDAAANTSIMTKTGALTVTKIGSFSTNFSTVYGTVANGKNTWYIYNVASGLYEVTTKTPKGWFEWETTLPYLHKFISILGSLCSPLIWLAIGMTLAESKIKEAVSDKWVWIYSLIKLIVIPLAVFAVFWGINKASGGTLIAKNVGIAMVIFAATPPATVAVGYAISENKCARLASSCSAFSTLLAVIILPIWIVVGELLFI